MEYRYLAIDVGLKRIGVAISVLDNIVTPINPIIRRNRNQASNDIRNLLKEWNIDRLIVGIPKDGSSYEQMKNRIEHFVKLIDFDNVIYQDESYSSFESSSLIAGISKNKKDGKSDSIAAMIILQRYLAIN